MMGPVADAVGRDWRGAGQSIDRAAARWFNPVGYRRRIAGADRHIRAEGKELAA
jgi:hypothetical protein